MSVLSLSQQHNKIHTWATYTCTLLSESTTATRHTLSPEVRIHAHSSQCRPPLSMPGGQVHAGGIFLSNICHGNATNFSPVVRTHTSFSQCLPPLSALGGRVRVGGLLMHSPLSVYLHNEFLTWGAYSCIFLSKSATPIQQSSHLWCVLMHPPLSVGHH